MWGTAITCQRTTTVKVSNAVCLTSSVCSQLDTNWHCMQMPGCLGLRDTDCSCLFFLFSFWRWGDGKKVKFWKWKLYLNEAVLNDTFSQEEQINHLKPNLLHKLRISLAAKYTAVSKNLISVNIIYNIDIYQIFLSFIYTVMLKMLISGYENTFNHITLYNAIAFSFYFPNRR